jgi:hypothetical protein
MVVVVVEKEEMRMRMMGLMIGWDWFGFCWMVGRWKNQWDVLYGIGLFKFFHGCP